MHRFTLDQFLALAAEAKTQGIERPGGRGWERSGGDGWDSNIAPAQALRYAREGLPSQMRPYDTDHLEIASGTATAFRTRNSMAGAVTVSRYLAGAPDCMRARTRTETLTRFVKIFVDGTCSAMVPAADMVRRGSIILGLVEALRTAQIGVDCYLIVMVGHGDNNPACVEIPSRPLDMSTAGFILGHPAFMRNICYSVAALHCKRAGKSWQDWVPWRCDVARLRRELACETTDIVIPNVFGREMTDPDTWIKERISQVTNG